MDWCRERHVLWPVLLMRDERGWTELADAFGPDLILAAKESENMIDLDMWLLKKLEITSNIHGIEGEKKKGRNLRDRKMSPRILC